MKNQNLSSLDISQMQQKVFDEAVEANRVYIVNWPADLQAQMNIVYADKKPEPLVLPEIKEVIKEVPVIIKEQEIKIVEVPHIVIETRIERIEVPVIVKELEIREVEKYVIQETQGLKEIVKEQTLPLWAKIVLILQTLTLLGLIFLK